MDGGELQNGVSSYEIHRAIEVTTQDCMVHGSPHCLALVMASSAKLSGRVEVDETFIGQGPHMRSADRARKILGTDGWAKWLSWAY